ncbi:MAG: DUF4333 domain-containing protein [Pseudonocardiaceae bacterium]
MLARPSSHRELRAGRSRAAALAMALGLLAVTGCQAGNGTSPATAVSPSPAPVPTTTNTSPTTTLTPLPRIFDESAVQDDVYQVLTQSYQVEGLGVVMCPAHQRVKAGTEFECTATINGAEKKVPITVTSADGRYSVGYPE